MKITIDDEEFDVPEKVAKKVYDASMYRFFLGGKSPSEVRQWLNRLEKNLDSILEGQGEITNTLKRITK